MNDSKPRLLLVNSYSMENAFNLWQKGKSGSHHVWGKIELERRRKVEVKIFPHEKYIFLNNIGKLLGIKYLDQQIRILSHSDDYNILYAPYSLGNTRFLLFLKMLGFYRKAILVTIHQPFLGMNSRYGLLRWLSKKVLLQYDGILYLSEKLKENTIKALKIEDPKSFSKIDTAQWGPDTDFYSIFIAKTQANGKNFISAGHTARDYVTLIEAFENMDHQLKIFCTPKSLPKVEELPDNVTIHSEFIPYVELMQYYVESKAILIPIKYPERLEGCQGMTSLQDVVALGKPTVITKNPSINIDAGAEGFGITVDKGDIAGWIAAVERLVRDRTAFQQMKANALRVYGEKFNSEIFSVKLEKAIMKICNPYKIDV